MVKRKDITKQSRERLYGNYNNLDQNARKEFGLQIEFDVYVQDPHVAKKDPKNGFAEEFFVRWEPGITDGPTSSRFAIVDYNADTETLDRPAKWSANDDAFYGPDEYILDSASKDSPQFRQMHVWAILQRALEFFEEGSGLGRPLPFGFEGSRLIVVPHAGYGKNAFYDRESKSLQFYYFDNDDGNTVYTCLSTDIINHEFGHAVLDGVRPYYYESPLVETGAFHEYVADMSAILLLLRNSTFRKELAKATSGDLSKAKQVSQIAEEFGHAITGEPFLRNAAKVTKMSEVSDAHGPHAFSEVLTGAMYKILLNYANRYVKRRSTKPANAFWYAIDRMQRTAIQPLDLLPPVDVTFRDYAIAVLRSEELTNPTDPHNYTDMMLKVFIDRGILTEEDRTELTKPRYVHDRLRVNIQHDIDSISRSRAAAYNFLDDNRVELFIPSHQDIIVADLYDTTKVTRQHQPLPRQIVLTYVWREDVELTGPRFGRFEGEQTTMLCGGTLVFDEIGNVLSWMRKPGTEGPNRKGWDEEKEIGRSRRWKFLNDIARQINAGRFGAIVGSEKGMLGSHIPPVTVSRNEGSLVFKRSPHMHLSREDYVHYEGGPTWQPSS